MDSAIQVAHDLEALRTATEARLPSLTETERRLHEDLRRHGVSRRRVIVAGTLVAACSTALAAPRLLESSSQERTQSNAVAGTATVSSDASGPLVAERAISAEPASSKAARAKRDALRSEIIRHAPAHAAHTLPRAEPEPSSALKNELGPGREPLVAYLNEEFSPLLADCVEQAVARSPNLSGMYAIGIETLAHDELGAVVEVAEPTDRNELSDPLFFECVRESAFTLIIPPPLTTGQEKFEVNGYFGPRP